MSTKEFGLLTIINKTNLADGLAMYTRKNIHFIKSKNTKPFHRLCKRIEGSRFLDLAYIIPITTPRNTRGNILWTLKCARAKATELTRMEEETGMYLVREGRRKPLNTTSSHMGAHTTNTRAYSDMATGSLARMDCSTLERVTGVEGKMGRRLRFSWESRFTRGNMKHPRMRSRCQLPFMLNLNQS